MAMNKTPPDLRLVVNESASTPDREKIRRALEGFLESSGLAGSFNHLLKSGFTIISTEPEKPGLKVTVTHDNARKEKPLFLILLFTEDEKRGVNQPVIECRSDDQAGTRLAHIMDAHSEIEKWVFRNLPRITASSIRPGFVPGPGLK